MHRGHNRGHHKGPWYRAIGLGHGQFAEKGLSFVGKETNKIVDDVGVVSRGVATGAASLQYVAMAGAAAVIGYALITKK